MVCSSLSLTLHPVAPPPRRRGGWTEKGNDDTSAMAPQTNHHSTTMATCCGGGEGPCPPPRVVASILKTSTSGSCNPRDSGGDCGEVQCNEGSIPARPSLPAHSIHDSGCEQRRNSSNHKEHKPTFRNIFIRSFAIDLGDHPDCSFGPPVALGWELIEEVRHNIDTYEHEKVRLGCYNPQFTCKLSSIRRRNMLLRAGYTPEQLDRAERDVAHTKRQRAATALLMPVSRLHEAALAFRTTTTAAATTGTASGEHLSRTKTLRRTRSCPFTVLPSPSTPPTTTARSRPVAGRCSDVTVARTKGSSLVTGVSPLPLGRSGVGRRNQRPCHHHHNHHRTRLRLLRSWSFRSDTSESVATFEGIGPEEEDEDENDDGDGDRDDDQGGT